MGGNVSSNLEAVSEMIGALTGMLETVEEDDYIESIIKEAHGDVKNIFDDTAAATAGATGKLAHMFEYGTPGVTRGQGVHSDPSAQEARLWVHTIRGTGGNQDIWFDFRPALTRNPQPTTASTGVPSKYLRKLSRRKYIFWNKAMVMEMGQEVSIKSDRGDQGLLFIPTPGDNAPRNFIMYPSKQKKAIRMRPGGNTMGSFSTFWLSWWETEGMFLISEHMDKNVSVDLERAQREAAKRAKTKPIKPAKLTNVNQAFARARAAGKKMVEKWR